jgi:hypothetical protein
MRRSGSPVIVGSYDYSFEFSASSLSPARSYRGTLKVTRVYADSISCTWSVQGYDAPCIRGIRVGTPTSQAVWLNARRVEGDTIEHTLAVVGGSLSCASAQIVFSTPKQKNWFPGTCSLTR